MAAYFAAEDCTANRNDDRTYLAVWALSSTFVDQVVASDNRYPSFYIVSAPAASNPNLHAQGGLFTLVQPRTDAQVSRPLPYLDDLIYQMDHEESELPMKDGTSWNRETYGPVLRKLTLPVTEAGVLLRMLGQAGVSAASIYPGLDGVAKSLVERQRWQWHEPGRGTR